MTTEPVAWSNDAISWHASSGDAGAIAEALYRRTCRVDFDAPGFCVLDPGQEMDSVTFRRLMVTLKRAMASIHEAEAGRTLVYLSAGRFDQQATTRPHLDGGPDECFLMLGYEPSAVRSELEIFDYARCAFDHGLTPDRFLAEHNPMFQRNLERLRPYGTRLPAFGASGYRIVCINNSCAPYSASEPVWQGVLHTATICAPDESAERMIDSTLIAPAPPGTPERIGAEALEAFAPGASDPPGRAR